jgi:hypothetical protein
MYASILGTAVIKLAPEKFDELVTPPWPLYNVVEMVTDENDTNTLSDPARSEMMGVIRHQLKERQFSDEPDCILAEGRELQRKAKVDPQASTGVKYKQRIKSVRVVINDESDAPATELRWRCVGAVKPSQGKELTVTGELVVEGGSDLPRSLTSRLRVQTDFTLSEIKKLTFKDDRGRVYSSLSGLKWHKTQKGKSDDELTNAKLTEALATKTEFTQVEWDAFGIKGLNMDHFIQLGGSYFQPVPDHFKASHFIKSDSDQYFSPMPRVRFIDTDDSKGRSTLLRKYDFKVLMDVYNDRDYQKRKFCLLEQGVSSIVLGSLDTLMQGGDDQEQERDKKGRNSLRKLRNDADKQLQKLVDISNFMDPNWTPPSPSSPEHAEYVNSVTPNLKKLKEFYGVKSADVKQLVEKFRDKIQTELDNVTIKKENETIRQGKRRYGEYEKWKQAKTKPDKGRQVFCEKLGQALHAKRIEEQELEFSPSMLATLKEPPETERDGKFEVPPDCHILYEGVYYQPDLDEIDVFLVFAEKVRTSFAGSKDSSRLKAQLTPLAKSKYHGNMTDAEKEFWGMVEPRAWAGPASGLKWCTMVDRGAGRELTDTNGSLTNALLQLTKTQPNSNKFDFTQADWDQFGIKDLCMDHFVKVDHGEGRTSYFQPAGPAQTPADEKVAAGDKPSKAKAAGSDPTKDKMKPTAADDTTRSTGTKEQFTTTIKKEFSGISDMVSNSLPGASATGRNASKKLALTIGPLAKKMDESGLARKLHESTSRIGPALASRLHESTSRIPRPNNINVPSMPRIPRRMPAKKATETAEA